MTLIEPGTGTGTGDTVLRAAAPGTGGDSLAFTVGDRSLGTTGTGPNTVPGTAGTAGPGTIERSPDHGTTERPPAAGQGDSGDQDRRGVLQRFRDWRDDRSARSLAAIEDRAKRDSGRRDTPLAQRDSGDRSAVIAVAAALDAQRAAKGKGPVPKKQTSKGDSLDGPPLPDWMQGIGLWVDRIFGSMPLVAPLIVSGFFTYHAGADPDGMGLPWYLAVLLSVAFEGGVWKLSRITDKSLVAGFSTIALRIGTGFYLLIISSVIYWHAMMKVGGFKHLDQHIGKANYVPAVASALLSALGVFIQARAARWARREALNAAGRMDKQAIKLAGVSWLLTPITNFKVLRHSVKYRIDSPLDAVRDYRLFRSLGKPKLWPPVPTVGDLAGDSPEATVEILRKWGLTPAPSLQASSYAFGGPAVPGTDMALVPGTNGTVPAVPVPVSPARIAAAVPPLSLEAGTGPADPTIPTVPQDNGTAAGTEGPAVMIRLADGTEIEQKTLHGYAERHRVRYATVIGSLPEGADPGFWQECPINQITTKAIKDAGGFAKQEYASEIRKLILARRAGYNPYATV